MNTAAKLDRRYTYADYATWPDDVRYELIGGIPYAMTPAPSDRHQEVLLQLVLAVGQALQGSPCRVRFAPYDVLLDAPEHGRKHADQVVQPDLVVICEEARIKDHGCEGPPDLIVEIVSPSSVTRDLIEKKDLYGRFGVGEYWVVDLEAARLHVFLPAGQGRLELAGSYGPADTLHSTAVAGLAIDLARILTPTSPPRP